MLSSRKKKLVLIFSWFIDHNKLYPNYEDSNYNRSLFTTPSSTKISTSPTQNEITLKGSEIECAKKNSKATLLNHLNLTLSFF